MKLETIVHDIPPLYDAESRVLLLGSLPSPASREAHFFYGHPRNRFWPVLAAVLGEKTPETIEEKREMCHRHHMRSGTPSRNATSQARRTPRSETLSRMTSAVCSARAKSSVSSLPAVSRVSSTES